MDAANGRPRPDISFVFAHDAQAPRAARDAVVPLLGPRSEDIGLVVSELVSNVVLHTQAGGRLDTPEGDVIPLRDGALSMRVMNGSGLLLRGSDEVAKAEGEVGCGCGTSTSQTIRVQEPA